MAQKKRNHYLPQVYLKGFSRNARNIFWYENTKDEITERNIKSVGFQNYLYALDKDDNKNMFMEDYLEKYIETPAAQTLDKLRNGDAITVDDRKPLSLFLGFLANRGPHKKAKINKFQEESVRAIVQKTISNEDYFAKAATSILSGDSTLSEELESYVMAKTDSYEVASTNAAFLKNMLHLSFAFTEKILNHKWQLIYAPSGSAFITTDKPVIHISSSFDSNLESFWEQENPSIVIPLTSKILLRVLPNRISKGEICEILSEQKLWVRQINQLMAAKATNSVFGRDKKLLKTAIRSRQREDVVDGYGVTINGKVGRLEDEYEVANFMKRINSNN